ncbi:MAG: hypothetical protein RLY93_06540 [Sumerlaeia bacterium]
MSLDKTSPPEESIARQKLVALALSLAVASFVGFFGSSWSLCGSFSGNESRSFFYAFLSIFIFVFPMGLYWCLREELDSIFPRPLLRLVEIGVHAGIGFAHYVEIGPISMEG